MENRREFFKKAGVAGGLGAAGAITLKKEYVKPVVRLLEPSTAYAQSPAIVVSGAVWTPNPVFSPTPPISTLVITFDVPGASPPGTGETFDVFVTITSMVDTGGWGAGLPSPPGPMVPGDSVTSAVMSNLGVASGGNQLAFVLNLTTDTVNAVAIPTAEGVPAAMAGFLGGPLASGDTARVTLTVDADAGTTIHGNSYPAQALGDFFVDFIFP